MASNKPNPDWWTKTPKDLILHDQIYPFFERAEDHTEVLNTGDDFKSGEPTALGIYIMSKGHQEKVKSLMGLMMWVKIL